MEKQIDAWGAPERYYAARVFDGRPGGGDHELGTEPEPCRARV